MPNDAPETRMIMLADIESQPASTLVCGHLVCQACAIVDRDWNRMRRGYMCSVCRVPNDVGRLYFPINIHILVDLMQQAYHSTSPTRPSGGPQGRDVGTLLYFCTLREALLNHFLLQMLKVQKVPAPLIERLMDDNRLAAQKFGSLFSSVVGKKWHLAVEQASARASIDFGPVSELMREASGLRNQFLHEGTGWAITREWGTRCMNSACHMAELFVALHNEFIHARLPASA